MTMETYHWERTHQSDPPVSLSIIRTLPDGDWTGPTRYDSLKAAMQAADDLAATSFHPKQGHEGCGEWLPVPPTHNVEP